MASRNHSSQQPLLLLDILPTEIQVHILRSLPDIRTLLSLLGASPRYLQVFQQSREDIISHVVCNHISPAILPIALDVCNLRDLRRNRRKRSEVLAYLDTFKQRNTSPMFHFSLETSKQLLKFHYIVEYFIEDFTFSRLSIISEYLKEDYPNLTKKRSTLDIPSIERNRVARAFYHLELYGSLFYDPRFPEDALTVTEQSTLFLARLTNWELEELKCVKLYLLDNLSVFANNAEDDHLQFYNILGPPDYVNHPRNPHLSEYDSRWDGDEWLFFSRDGSDGRFQETWMESCLNRGLMGIKSMLEADTPAKRDAYLGEPDFPRSTMAAAISALPSISNHTKSEWLEQYAESGMVNSLEYLNEAWVWALRGELREDIQCRAYTIDTRRLTLPPRQDRVDEGLQRWGYAIWNKETLDTLKVLSESVASFCRNKHVRASRRESDDIVEVRSRDQWIVWREELRVAGEMDGKCGDGSDYHVSLLYQGWEEKRIRVLGRYVESDDDDDDDDVP